MTLLMSSLVALLLQGCIFAPDDLGCEGGAYMVNDRKGGYKPVTFRYTESNKTLSCFEDGKYAGIAIHNPMLNFPLPDPAKAAHTAVKAECEKSNKSNLVLSVGSGRLPVNYPQGALVCSKDGWENECKGKFKIPYLGLTVLNKYKDTMRCETEDGETCGTYTFPNNKPGLHYTFGCDKGNLSLQVTKEHVFYGKDFLAESSIEGGCFLPSACMETPSVKLFGAEKTVADEDVKRSWRKPVFWVAAVSVSVIGGVLAVKLKRRVSNGGMLEPWAEAAEE